MTVQRSNLVHVAKGILCDIVIIPLSSSLFSNKKPPTKNKNVGGWV